ncbi:hypothetical protein FJZ26_02720 [Candidatus Parvarchaeota archaeon]|nr:hypothetical protein [Candidatus Parvarchaeota archaeon]
MEIAQGLKYSFGALLDERPRKDYIVFAGMYFVYGLGMLLVSIAAGFLPQSLAFFSAAMAFTLGILIMAAREYYSGKFLKTGLENESLSPGDYSLKIFWKYILTNIILAAQTLVFWRDKRYLVLYIFPFLAVVAGLLARFFLMPSIGAKGVAVIASIGFAPVALAWIYFWIRQAFAPELCLVNSQLGMFEYTKKSWEMTQGKALKIFTYYAAFFVAQVAALVPFAVAWIVLTFIIGRFTQSTAASRFIMDMLAVFWVPLIMGVWAYARVYVFCEIRKEKSLTTLWSKDAAAEKKQQKKD